MALRDQIGALEERLAPLLGQTDSSRERELAASAAVADARGALDHVYQELRAVEALAAERAANEAERRAQIHSARADIDRLEQEHRTALAERDVHHRQAAEARAKFGEREALIVRYETEAVAQRERARIARERGEAATARVAELQRRHREIGAELAGAESRLHTIEELEAALEGHAHGTRAVVEASQRGHLHGLHGVVSNLISTDERYARALDVAFGAGLSNIIAATSEDAEAAVAYLRERELGRATFLPLDTLAQREGRELGQLRGRAGSDRLRAHAGPGRTEYRGIVAFLVGRDPGRRRTADRHRARPREGFRDSVVTLEGDQIMGGGAITGGRFRKERSILARRAQAETLKERIPQLRAQLEAIERDGTAAKAELDAAAAERDEATKLANEAEVALRDVRTQLQGLGADIERLDAAAGASAARIASVGTTREDVQSRLHALERVADDHVDLSSQRIALETSLAAARARIAAVEAEQADVVAAASALREQIAALSAERDGSFTRLGLLDADAERAGAARETMLRELEALRGRAAELQLALAAARERVATVDGIVETARRDREATADQSHQREADERIAQAEDRDLTAAGEAGRRRLAEIDAELGMLQQTFAQNPAERRRVGATFWPASPKSRTASSTTCRGCAKSWRRLQANVNLNAETDRDELIERERFLREQMDDLHKARETLLSTIAEIETSCQVQFNETFDAGEGEVQRRVRANFSPAAKPRCGRPIPSNLSETGIEIAVQPPGKKMTAARRALGRRTRDDGVGADLRADRGEAVAVLPARRGRRRARRRERRAPLDQDPRRLGRRADADRHAQQEDDGVGAAHVRRHDAGAGGQFDRQRDARRAADRAAAAGRAP